MTVTNADSLARRATAGAAQGLAVWSAAWLAGSAGSDNVLGALGEWAPVQSIAAHDGPAGRVDGDVPSLLAAVRALTPHAVRLLLPAPGDARGLPPGSEAAVAAVRRGEATVFDGAGASLVLVPTPEAADVMRWQVFRCAPPLRDPDSLNLSEAEHLLAEAVRAAPGALAALPPAPDVAAQARATVATLTAQLGSHRLPAAASARAHRVLERASAVEAILLVAGAHRPHTGISLAAAQAGDGYYRELWTIVRAARTAAINAVCRDALGR